MNLDKEKEQEYFLMSLASLLLKRPFSWLSLLAPPLLHILGLRFLHLFLTSVVLFFSSFFFPISLPLSIQTSKHDQEQGQDDQEHGQVDQKHGQDDQEHGQDDQEHGQVDQEHGQVDQEQGQDDQDYVTTEAITGKSEESLETTTTNEEDDDGAISDDESLIELSLPSGHYLGHHYNTCNKNHLIINNKVQDFKFFDFFNEFNDFIEEDNLIEIDISIGLIKYSRFEIKV